MNEPVTRFGSARTIGRGMRVAPALSHGLGLTFGFAFLGTGARLVIPILIQQSIDHGLQPNQVRVSFIVMLGVIGACRRLHRLVVIRTRSSRLQNRSTMHLLEAGLEKMAEPDQ